jgi:hypothetical protein
MRVVLIACVLMSMVACATSSPSGGGIDATAGDDDAGAIDSGGATPDSIPGTAPDASVSEPDAMNNANCPTAPCDLLEQCGCNATQACDIDFNDLAGTACRGVSAQGDDNDTCASITACAAGYVCVGDATNDSCKQYCDMDADCGTPRGQCVIQLTNSTGTPIAGATVCSSNCDPSTVANPLCPTGWGCDIFTATFNSVDHDIADCRVVGAGAQGAACSATAACAAGFTCVNTGTNVCARICRRPAGTECTGGTTCTSFTTPFVVGAQEYGVCI